MDIFPSFLDINYKNHLNHENQNLFSDWIYDLQSLCIKRRYREKEVLYKANDIFKNLYYIHQGCIKTFKTSSNGIESISGFQTNGGWAGLESIGSIHHNNYAQALAQSDIFVINYQALHQFLMSSYNTLRKFNKLLSNEIIRNINLLNILRNSKRENKLVLFFLDFSKKHAHSKSDQMTLELPMSRGDISSYLSISREEISRILQKLQYRGLIEVNNRQICLLDLPRLIHISGFSVDQDSQSF